jgi:hypothetical protein
MNEKLYPSDLTEEEWDFIKELIPDAEPGGRRRELCMRQVLNAIFLCDERGDSMANIAARLSQVEERLSLLSTMASEWGMGADSRPLASKGA